MKKLLCLIGGLSLANLEVVWANNSGDFANCSLANKQLKMLNDFMEPELRVRASQALIKDIEALRPNIIKNKTGLPDKLIKLCFDIKRSAFKATFVKGGPALFGSYDFLIAAGKYLFYEQEWSTSYDAFEEAVRLRPNLYEPSYYALHALVYTQYTAEKPMPTAAYDRKARTYVDYMLKAKDIRPDQKKLAIGFLARAEERASKMYSARTMLKRSMGLSPRDLKIRLQLGELEEKSGQFKEAQKVYEEALAALIIDPETEKKIYANLLRIYSLLGEKKKLAEVSTRAVALYPNEPFFKKMNEQNRAPASVKK